MQDKGKGEPYLNLGAQRWAHKVKRSVPNKSRGIFLHLATHCDTYGCMFWSQRRIAEDLGCSIRNCRNHLRILEKLGYLRTIPRSKNAHRWINIYHLVGWPERKALPETGHPYWGKGVEEETIAAQTLRKLRQNLPLDGETFAEQYKDYNYNTITSKLQLCFEALGPWATEENKYWLTQKADELESFIGMGIDLKADVLPVLEVCALSSRKIPKLRSWNYFAEAIGQRQAMFIRS